MFSCKMLNNLGLALRAIYVYRSLIIERIVTCIVHALCHGHSLFALQCISMAIFHHRGHRYM